MLGAGRGYREGGDTGRGRWRERERKEEGREEGCHTRIGFGRPCNISLSGVVHHALPGCGVGSAGRRVFPRGRLPVRGRPHNGSLSMCHTHRQVRICHHWREALEEPHCHNDRPRAGLQP